MISIKIKGPLFLKKTSFDFKNHEICISTKMCILQPTITT